MTFKLHNWLPAFVFLTIAAACFIHLGAPSLYETDEGFAANRADSFYRHHTWRLSFDDVGEDGPQFRKPPLLYWCVAALFKVFGHSMWAVRLPTAIAGFLCALLTWRLARRFLDNASSLAAALLLVVTPFVLFHIRTAMLEMPLLCLTLAGICSFAFLSRREFRILGAGMAAGAAIILKGGAGVYALVVPLVFGLLYRRCRPTPLKEIPWVLATAALLPLAYFAAVPIEFRSTMVQRLFVEEASERIRLFRDVFARLPFAFGVLKNTLVWHIPAAAGGFLLLTAGIRRHNAWERLSFLVLVILSALPLLWIYASMVHPFPRYLLPVYPLLLILSSAFAQQALESRWPALWLVAFAIAAVFFGSSPLRWIPVGTAAALALFSAWMVRLPNEDKYRSWLTWLLLAAIAIPSALAPSARFYLPKPERGDPRPELVPLALRLQELVPEGEKVLVAERTKCHTILFYGRRSIDSVGDWLLSTAQPGASRYGIFPRSLPRRAPGVAVEEIQHSASWRLVKLTVLPSRAPWAGILFSKDVMRSQTAATLDNMNIEAEPFDKGFLLRRIPDTTPLNIPPSLRLTDPAGGESSPVLPTKSLVLPSGGRLTLSFPSPVTCAGFDVVPEAKTETMEGWRVEYRVEDTGTWTPLCSVDKPFIGTFDIVNGRLTRTDKFGLRLRFNPITARQWMLTRTASTSITLAEVTCRARR